MQRLRLRLLQRRDLWRYSGSLQLRQIVCPTHNPIDYFRPFLIVYATVCNSLAVVCTGLSRGVCECGTCRCRSGYTGMSCECPTSDETCRGANGLICNGQGTCQCGMCFCNDYYTGAACQVYMVSSSVLEKSYPCSILVSLRITHGDMFYVSNTSIFSCFT